MQIDHLDHLVLTVQNIQTTCEFYSRVLGMQVITFDERRKALRFGNQKINLHLKGKEIDPKAQHPTLGSADLCFLTSMPLEQVITHLQSCNVSVLLGPVKQTGATTSLGLPTRCATRGTLSSNDSIGSFNAPAFVCQESRNPSAFWRDESILHCSHANSLMS